MTFQTLVLWINAPVFALYGLAFALKPALMSQTLTGATPDTPSALTDMRATYGGFMLSIGLWLGWAAYTQKVNEAALLAVLLVMICMAATRAYGMMIDGSPNFTMKLSLAAEIIAAILSIAALKSGTS